MALAVVSAFALIAWTFSLAAAIAAIVEQRSIQNACLGLIGFLAIRLLAKHASALLLSRSSSTIQTVIREKLVAIWCASEPLGNADEPNADRATLLGPGVDALGSFYEAFIPARILGSIIPAVILVMIAILDRWTLLILLFAGPMLLLLLAVIGGRTRLLADRRFRELGWLRSFYLDMVQGIPTLNVFRRSEESINTIENVSNRLSRTTMDVLRTAFQTSLVIEWAATAATALVASK